jgi:hypothetical protein
MAECRCGVCEHCTDSLRALVRASDTIPGVSPEGADPNDIGTIIGPLAPAEWSPPPERPLVGVKPLTLLSRHERELAYLTWLNECPAYARLLQAYEVAVHLLEECVRARGEPRPDGLVTASDVAWLKLREAEK